METLKSIYNELAENENYHFDCDVVEVKPLTREEVKKYSEQHNKHKCSIEYMDKQIEFESISVMYPSGYDIIYNVVSDARSGRNCETFNDFCDEYGFSNDSIKALKIYEECKEINIKLHDLFGETLFNRFMVCDRE